MSGPTPERSDEAFWRDFLTRGDSNERKVRGVFRRLPHGPRCKLCAAPFEGAAAPLMRMLGKRRSEQNPTMCTSCFDFMRRHHGGAEIDVSLLFADIRGSTTIAEGMTAGAFRGVLDRFYATASKAVFDHDGSVDKFVGDELMALFFPLLSGDDHVARAIAAARAVLGATGHDDAAGPWVPIGAGVHAGVAWVGSVGDEAHAELTAVGDVVNTAARIAAAAAAGEILVSADAASAAGLGVSLPRRTRELRGKGAPTEVVSIRVGAAAAS
jgi:adenylate cyclase